MLRINPSVSNIQGIKARALPLSYVSNLEESSLIIIPRLQLLRPEPNHQRRWTLDVGLQAQLLKKFSVKVPQVGNQISYLHFLFQSHFSNSDLTFHDITVMFLSPKLSITTCKISYCHLSLIILQLGEQVIQAKTNYYKYYKYWIFNTTIKYWVINSLNETEKFHSIWGFPYCGRQRALMQT